MAKRPISGILATFAPKPQETAAPTVPAEPVASAAPEKKRRKQLVFLVTDEQETRLNHFRADLGNIKIQALFQQALNMLLESKGQPPL